MKKAVIALSLFVFPVVVSAQAQLNKDYLQGIKDLVVEVLGWLVPILIALAFVWFLYNVFAYMIKTEPDAKEGARKQMIYGIIGLAIMIAVWGLVGVVTSFFGVDNAKLPTLPGLPK